MKLFAVENVFVSSMCLLYVADTLIRLRQIVEGKRKIASAVGLDGPQMALARAPRLVSGSKAWAHSDYVLRLTE